MSEEFPGFTLIHPKKPDDYHRSSKEIVGTGWPDWAAKKRKKRGKIKSNAASSFLFLFNGGRCTYCTKSIDSKEVTIDHIVPQSRCGSSLAFNQAIACVECNKNKADRILTPTELRRFFGEARTLTLLDEYRRCGIVGVI